MHILYVARDNPLKQHDGPSVRCAAMWKALKELGHVEMVVMRDDPLLKTVDDERNDIHFVHPFNSYCGKPRWKFFSLFSMFLQSFDGFFLSKEEILRGLKAKRESYDAIVVYYPAVATAIAAWKLGDCYIDFEDHPSDYFDLHFARQYGWPVRCIKKFLLLKWYYAMCRHCKGAWTVRESDVRRFPAFCNCSALPNIVGKPGGQYKIPKDDARFLMAVGSMCYGPNHLGITRFIKEFWPTIRNRHPDIRFVVVGRGAPKESLAFWQSVEGVEVTGYVEDIHFLYENALGVVTPLWDGGGTSIKLIEGCVCGCKVFATPMSIRGIDRSIVDSLKVAVFSSPEQCATAVDEWVSLRDDERFATRCAIFEGAKSLGTQDEFSTLVRQKIIKS